MVALKQNNLSANISWQIGNALASDVINLNSVHVTGGVFVAG